MGTINKSGQASITNGKLGTTTNYSLGSTGTTKYSLNKGGALVTTQWLIAGVPWSKTLIPGDTIEHSWQLGSTGTTEYNMGAGGSKTLKYTLDPGGNITESNGRLSGKSGTASYTLGTGSQSNIKASLGKGSTQTYTVGPGGSSTISITEAGVPTTITLGPGDSSTTTITEGAKAVLESESVHDPANPKVESMDYDVGDDGSTDNTFGGNVWDVWLFQPYFVNGFPEERTDFDPICVVMPRGEYNPGCPGRLPSFIQSNGDYPPGTNCRYILIGSATKNGVTGFWDVTQNAIGTLTFATENTKQDITTDSPEVAPLEVVNHYQTSVFGYPGFWQLRVGRGGNVWRPINEDCDKQLRTDVITPSAVVGLNVGSNVDSGWASDEGYVDIYEESDYYVYAYKVETDEDTYFYIYVTTDGTLDSACPVVLPEEIETPIVDHTVQVLRVAVAYFEEGRWHVSQKVVGSIAWPQTTGAEPYVPPPEQFETRVVAGVEEGEWQVQVAKGRVITGGGRSAVGEWDIQAFAVYPTGANVVGTDTASPYANLGGHVKITNAAAGGSNTWHVLILSNPSEANFPLLSVVADGSDAYTKSTPWTSRVAWIDVCPYTVAVLTIPDPPYEAYLKYFNTVEGVHQVNYNCQRLKVATIYWDGTFSQWIVRQWLIGSLTNPDINWWNGNREYDTESGVPSWASTIEYATEQAAWLGAWTGYSKWDGSGSHPSVNLLTS
jgi:hypothetical protein